ncbi:MAG: sugar ABC transporter substrate-binding protein [Clostridiales bacterium]|nr:sugar ABC transporter substrate-binding protein [Clostridiales bacterium]
MKFKKIAVIALSSLLALGGCLGFVGCADQSGKEKITFMGWTNSTEKKAYKKAIAQFEELYNCKVDYNTVAVGEYRSKLNSTLSADALNGECSADVFYVPYGMLWNKAVSGHIENLQPYIDADTELDLNEFWDEPGFYQYKLDGNQVGVGDIYAFPKDVGPMALVYNKDLFAEYGLTAPSLDHPWNWDDLFVEGKKVDNRIGNPGAKRNAWLLSGYNLEQAVWGNDASFLSEDRKTVTVDSPKFIESLEFIRRLTVEGIKPNSTEIASLDGYTRWMNGQIGIFVAGPWDLAVYNEDLDFEWDYFPLIAGPNGTQATSTGYMGLAMSSRSEHKDLAYDFIKFLTTNEECQRTLYQAGQIVPNIKSKAKGEFIDYYKDERPNVGEWINILERTGHPFEYYMTPSDAWFTPFNNSVGNVFNGDVSAAEFCMNIKAQMQEQLDISYREMEQLKENMGWGK